MVVKPSVVALLSVTLVSCADPVAPTPEPPPRFSFDMSVTGSVAASFSGMTVGQTMQDGYARGTTPTGPITATDATNFTMIPEGETVGLAVTLLGPFEVGSYKLLRADEPINPAAKRFEVYYTARTSPNTFHRYVGINGTVTVTLNDLDRRIVTFSLSADSAEVIERGTFRGVVSSPVQISATLIERRL